MPCPGPVPPFKLGCAWHSLPAPHHPTSGRVLRGTPVVSAGALACSDAAASAWEAACTACGLGALSAGRPCSLCQRGSRVRFTWPTCQGCSAGSECRLAYHALGKLCLRGCDTAHGQPTAAPARPLVALPWGWGTTRTREPHVLPRPPPTKHRGEARRFVGRERAPTEAGLLLQTPSAPHPQDRRAARPHFAATEGRLVAMSLRVIIHPNPRPQADSRDPS